MSYKIMLPAQGTTITAEYGDNLLEALRSNGFGPDAPCGGLGKCGKCKVLVEGKQALSCQYTIQSDIAVELSKTDLPSVLLAGDMPTVKLSPLKRGPMIAFDIGTTTVACFLMDENGIEIASESMLNPQICYGADVISRIRNALDGQLDTLTKAIRDGMTELIQNVCKKVGICPADAAIVSVVGNPCMQQLFLGISPENLAEIPFAPVIVRASVQAAAEYLPICCNALLLTVPDVAGFIGADTMACVLASGMYEAADTILLVDIGTNGEMVLSHEGRMVACSAAAGPALEGANISSGMRGSAGAIDHVWSEKGKLTFSTIKDIEPRGICGSGLIDTVAFMIENGIVNARGRIQTEKTTGGTCAFHICGNIWLTQEDITQVQLTKGAIAAGIQLMAEHLGIVIDRIDRVLLAGAFGTFMRPESACKIGMLPAELDGKVSAVGNIAGSGAKLIACNAERFWKTEDLMRRIEFLELSKIPNFSRVFAQCMRFP